MKKVNTQIQFNYIREFPNINIVFNFIKNNTSNIINVYHFNLGGCFENDIEKKELIYSLKDGWIINSKSENDLIRLFDYKEFSREIFSNQANLKLWNVALGDEDKISFDFLPHTFIFETFVPYRHLSFKV